MWAIGLLITIIPHAGLEQDVPLSAEINEIQNSGIDVPIATMVSPITICGNPIRSAIPTEPVVSLSAP